MILTRNTTFVDGVVLSASDLHTELDWLYTGLVPSQLEDESSDAAAHQAMSDPTGGALPNSMQGEIQQLRYKIDEIQGTTHWYTSAPDDLTNLNSTVADHATRITALETTVGNHTTQIAALQTSVASIAGIRGFVVRPHFVYQDNDEIEIHGGAWEIAGRVVRITSATTVDITPTSSANMHYIYLDESNITALSSYTIDTSSVRTSTTAPSWSSVLNGWYNSSDRCIGAFYGDSTGIRQFLHANDFFAYANPPVELSGQDASTTYADLALKIPGFAIEADVVFHAQGTQAADRYVYWNTQGVSITNTSDGHPVSRVNSNDNAIDFTPAHVIASSSENKISYCISSTTGVTLGVRTNGWYFPVGM